MAVRMRIAPLTALTHFSYFSMVRLSTPPCTQQRQQVRA